MTPHSLKPNYGIDAPDFVFGCLLGGSILAVGGCFLPPFRLFGSKVAFVGPALSVLGCGGLALGGCLVAYVLRGKFNIRESMLSLITWQGNEKVLDVGTGSGLLAIGAAKRLTTGQAVGIDIWNAADLSDNKVDKTLANIRLEGVEGKVEIRSEDVRKMSFADGAFDIIFSLLCIHNITNKEERAVACQEIARVLKPGGTAVIGDYTNSAEYAAALTRAGLVVESRVFYWREAYSSIWIVVATKPM